MAEAIQAGAPLPRRLDLLDDATILGLDPGYLFAALAFVLFVVLVCAACCCRYLSRRRRRRGVAEPKRVSFHPRAVLVVAIVAFTFLLSIASLAGAVILQIRFANLRENVVLDPEKVYMDECLQDFQHMAPNASSVQKQREKCLGDLEKDDRFRRLPLVRLAVDELFCGPVDLCSQSLFSGDPGSCLDRSVYGEANYKAGDITRCYNLIGEAKSAATPAARRAVLVTQVERDCLGAAAWDNYEHARRIEYCMWKHNTAGICMNTMRTGCPQDTSCCPVAANVAGSGRRPNQYECRKSPTLGLYCLHTSFRPEGNATRELCTRETCPNFAWCMDFVDVPGLCLGDACELYSRALPCAAALVAFAALALAADLGDLVGLFRCPRRAKLRAAVNLIGASSKAVAFLLVLAAGLAEFLREAVDHECFTAEGNKQVRETKVFAEAVKYALPASAIGSTLLSPLSVHWAGRLIGLPYARLHRADTAGEHQ